MVQAAGKGYTQQGLYTALDRWKHVTMTHSQHWSLRADERVSVHTDRQNSPPMSGEGYVSVIPSDTLHVINRRRRVV